MTTPDPRTDLAGYLGLSDEQVEKCRLFADAEGSISAKVGARLIEQDQARADEPDDGLIPVTVRLTAEEVSGEGESWDTAVDKLCDACAAIDLPAPKSPWKSPLDDLPDLTEQDCRNALWAYSYHPGTLMAQIGRALIAAGWTPS